MKRIIFCFLFASISFSLCGQNNVKSEISLIDSLKTKLELNQNDTLKAQLLMMIAISYQFNHPDSAIYYGERALEQAKKFKNVPVMVGTLGFIGTSLRLKGNLPKAMEMAFNAIELSKNLPVSIASGFAGIGPAYMCLGSIYSEIGDYSKAKQYLNKVIAFGEKDLIGVAAGYYEMALVYEKSGMLDSAIIYLDKSYKAHSTLNFSYYPKVYDVYPGWYNLRAKIYLKQNKPDLALSDLKKTLQMTLRNGEAYFSANSYNDISAYYGILNQSDSVISYAEKGLAEAYKISYTKGILDASEILAGQFETKDPTKALFYYKLATETRNKLFGAGNIQIMRDMIAQNEKKQAEIEAAKVEYKNRLRMNSILGVTFTLLIIAVFLFINSRRKQKAKQKIELAYDKLKSTQAQLIQSEKMASLGELTAGIAHEIQNPLNFVNNFSEVSNELIAEIEEERAKNQESRDENLVSEILSDIRQNLEKINHHGKRADAIVKGMLQHSRTSTGQKEPTDINALADEYLRLAYHGLRAKDKSFNADYKLEVDESLPKINVIPHDIGRVLLNLINNAFYACAERSRSTVNEKVRQTMNDFKPMVVVTSKLVSNKVEIRVQDNGNGIPDSVKEKIFQPFFTTKPTGQGTGLGLSLSYDIVKAHGGAITVESKENEGTEFIITIPVK